MKKIKAFVSIALLLSVFTIFTACSSKTETGTYRLEQNGVVSTLVFTYKGDRVLTQTTENTVPYSSINATNEEEAKAVLEAAGSSEYEGVDGITYSLTFSDDEAIEKITLDYATLDYEKASAIPGMYLDENAKKAGVSYKATTQALMQAGYKKVTE